MIKLLLPAAWIYGAVTDIRNWLFEHRLLPSERYPVPVICIGNLAVGGTGKTPHTEWLIHHFLSEGRKIAVLSRGYGRLSKGFRRVEADSTAGEVGDEPLQIRRKFNDNRLTCAVCENRRNGIQTLLEHEPKLELILLDDAFQHRYVEASCYVLLTDYRRLYVKDHPFPAGQLREKRSGAQRAHIIVVTKCPSDLSEQERESITRSLQPLPHQRVFFTTIRHTIPSHPKACLLITGIARPLPLLDHLEEKGIDVEHLAFPDHHRFTPKDRTQIVDKARSHTTILTTEKDAVRLEELRLPEEISARIQIIKITPSFLFGEEHHFLKTLYNYVGENSRNSRMD